MNVVRKSLPLLRQCPRSFSSAADKQIIEKINPRAKLLKNIQERFQIEDGVPVYLKAGFRDILLYRATVASTIFLFGWSCKVFWELVQK